MLSKTIAQQSLYNFEIFNSNGEPFSLQKQGVSKYSREIASLFQTSKKTIDQPLDIDKLELMLTQQADALSFLRLNQNLGASFKLLSESSYRSAQSSQSIFSDLFEIKIVEKARNRYIQFQKKRQNTEIGQESLQNIASSKLNNDVHFSHQESNLVELKKYLYAPEIFSIEVKSFKECKLRFEDCSFLNIEIGIGDSIFLRVKMQEEMDFRVVQVLDIQSIPTSEMNTLCLALRNFQIHQKHLSQLSKVNSSVHEILGLEGYFMSKDASTQIGYDKIYFVYSDFNCTLRDLHELRRRSSDPYTESMLLNLLEDCLNGLSNLQKLGVCHRNIRPDNICFSHRTCKYKIMNFSLANGGKDRFFESYSLVGCPTYLPIDILTTMSIQNNKICFRYDSERSDIYSLAVVFLELICLKLEQRDLLETNSFYLFLTINTLQDINHLLTLARQKFALHNYLLHVLRLCSENRVISRGLIRLLSQMLQVSSSNRIDLVSALGIVNQLKKGHRRVFENEESDIKYSKFVQKKQLVHQKSSGDPALFTLQKNIILSQFYSAINKDDKAFTLNKEILEMLKEQQGKSTILTDQIVTFPQLVNLHIQQAKLLIDKNLHSEALELVNLVLEVEKVCSLQQIAAFRISGGNTKVQHSEKYNQADLLKAQCFFNLGKVKESISHFEKILQSSGNRNSKFEFIKNLQLLQHHQVSLDLIAKHQFDAVHSKNAIPEEGQEKAAVEFQLQSILLMSSFDYKQQIQLQKTLASTFVSNLKIHDEWKNWINFLLCVSSSKNHLFDLAAKFSEQLVPETILDQFFNLISQGITQAGINRNLSVNRCSEAISKLKVLDLRKLKRSEIAQILIAANLLVEQQIEHRKFKEGASTCDLLIQQIENKFTVGHFLTMR